VAAAGTAVGDEAALGRCHAAGDEARPLEAKRVYSPDAYAALPHAWPPAACHDDDDVEQVDDDDVEQVLLPGGAHPINGHSNGRVYTNGDVGEEESWEEEIGQDWAMARQAHGGGGGQASGARREGWVDARNECRHEAVMASMHTGALAGDVRGAAHHAAHASGHEEEGTGRSRGGPTEEARDEACQEAPARGVGAAKVAGARDKWAFERQQRGRKGEAGEGKGGTEEEGRGGARAGEARASEAQDGASDERTGAGGGDARRRLSRAIGAPCSPRPLLRAPRCRSLCCPMPAARCPLPAARSLPRLPLPCPSVVACG